MKYVDEYRKSEVVKALAAKIGAASAGRHYTFMEVCGTHTMAIARFGIKKILSKNIRLISGPGCPVCVTPNEYVDKAVALARNKDVIITTFGDMMRVPGSTSSLENEKTNGADVRVVYSPIDSLKIAKENPKKKVVFLSVGFETTIPTVAATIIEADKGVVNNFFILTSNKIVVPALEALAQGEAKLNGLILPGHVSTIIGEKAYVSFVEKYRIPCSIAGFEPVDILESILDLIKQVNDNSPKVSSSYGRAVKFDGNEKALGIMNEVFGPCDAVWRGVGSIPGSGLKLKDRYRKYDAAVNIKVRVEETVEPKNCVCGQILQGIKEPCACPLFGKICTPEHPVGACMVSSEGTCAAYFKYEA